MAHVHFEAADVLAHDNNIIVKQPKTGKIDIHAGFLQILHKYQIIVPIPDAFLPQSQIKPQDSDVPSMMRLVKMESNKENLVNFTFEVTPQKEKLYKEKLTLVDAKNLEQCVITLNCRVLGKQFILKM